MASLLLLLLLNGLTSVSIIGVLTSLSSVFANMFTNPQPTKANMQNYGCPVIEVTGSAEDWEIVLKAYLLRRYVCTNPTNVFSFDHSYKWHSYDFVEMAALPLRVVTAYLCYGILHKRCEMIDV